MRRTIERYVRQEKALIQKAKVNAEGIFKGVSAREILENPKAFAEFILHKAANRFAETTLQESATIGLMLSESLKNEASDKGRA